jgi:hypothetical protein
VYYEDIRTKNQSCLIINKGNTRMSYGQFGLSRNQMLGIGGVGTVALGGGGAYLLNRRRKARLAAEAEAAMLADEADEAEYAMAVAQGATFRRPLMSPRLATGLKIGAGVGALGLAGAGVYAGHRLRQSRLAAEAEAAMLAEEEDAEYAMALARSATFRRPNPMMGRLATGLKVGAVGTGALGLGAASVYAGHRLRKAQLAAEAEAALLAEEEADEAEYAMAQAQSARFGALARRNFLLSRTGRLAGKIGAVGAGVGMLGLAGRAGYVNTGLPDELDELEEDDDAMYAMARPSAANFMGRRLGSRVVDALEGGIQNTVGRRMMMGNGASRKAARRLAVGGGIAAGVGALGAGGYGIYRGTRPPVVEEEMGEDEYIDE